MKEAKGNRHHNLIRAAALALISLIGFAGCRTLPNKSKEPRKEQPVIPKRDTIQRPPYEAVAMYGTPYRRFEPKSAVPDDNGRPRTSNSAQK